MPSYMPHEYAIYKKELKNLEKEIEDFSMNLVTTEDAIQALKERVEELSIRLGEAINALSMENKRNDWSKLVDDSIKSKMNRIECLYDKKS